VFDAEQTPHKDCFPTTFVSDTELLFTFSEPSFPASHSYLCTCPERMNLPKAVKFFTMLRAAIKHIIPLDYFLSNRVNQAEQLRMKHCCQKPYSSAKKSLVPEPQACLKSSSNFDVGEVITQKTSLSVFHSTPGRHAIITPLLACSCCNMSGRLQARTVKCPGEKKML